MTRCRRGGLWAAVAALCAALFLVGHAWAHAELLDAAPAAGSTVHTPPSEIRLTFNETLVEGSGIAVHGEQFRPVGTVTTIIAGSQMRGLLTTTLEPGTYTVEWAARSVDGHLVSGSYPFTVAASPPPARNWAPTIAAGVSILTAALAILIWYLNRRSRL